MSTAASYPHLTVDDNGCAWIGRTRYKVKHLAAEHYQHWWTAEEIIRQHPDLRPEEVYVALAYFYDHYQEMVNDLQESYERIVRVGTASPVSREELTRRVSNLDS